MKSILGSLAVGTIVLYVVLAHSTVPVSGALNAYFPNVINQPSVVSVPPIGITPTHIVRLSVMLMSPKGFMPPIDFLPGDPAPGGCAWDVTVYFMTEKRVQLGLPTKFQLRPGETGHADLDGAVAPMFFDQYGRLQTRAIARVDPSTKKCEALVGTSLELFDRITGDTVAMSGDFSVKPIDRAEPPPSP
jgi:hypothetical protein